MNVPNALWATADLRAAANAVKNSVYAAIELLCLAKEQAAGSALCPTADDELAVAAQNLLHSTQTARDLIRPLASEFIFVRSGTAVAAPAWCGRRDAFTLGSAFGIAELVMDGYLVSLPEKPSTRALILPNPQTELSDSQRALLSRAREQVVELAGQYDVPAYEEVAAAVDVEIGMVMLARVNSKPPDSEVLRRLGEQYLENLDSRKKVIQEVSPEEANLRQYLSNDLVGGKFVPWWHQHVAEAKLWRIPISPTWNVIVSCFDHLFPGTSNTFNPADNRPCVQESELFAYLAKHHSLSEKQASELTLKGLAQLLQTDRSRSDKPVRKKRSTEQGEANAKLIAALTKHHEYAEGGCLNLEPIGNNALARLAGVDQATASAFFKQQFKGHGKYKAACADAALLTAALKLLNGEFAAHLLYGSKPADEDERDEE